MHTSYIECDAFGVSIREIANLANLSATSKCIFLYFGIKHNKEITATQSKLQAAG